MLIKVSVLNLLHYWHLLLVGQKHLIVPFEKLVSLNFTFDKNARPAILSGANLNRNEFRKGMKFFLNVYSLKSLNLVTKVFFIKRAWTCHLLCKSPGCYQSTRKTHVRDRIFKFSQIHASVIIRFPEFAEFNESSMNLGKTPMDKVDYTLTAWYLLSSAVD